MSQGNILLAAARAYCRHRYNYDATYMPGGQESHMNADIRGTAAEPWLSAVVDAVLVHAGHDVCDRCGRCRDCGGQHQITCEHR